MSAGGDGGEERKLEAVKERNAILLELLRAVEELESVHQDLNEALKQGFFSLTRARMSSSGPAVPSYSVLDARGHIEASFRVQVLEDGEAVSGLEGLGKKLRPICRASTTPPSEGETRDREGRSLRQRGMHAAGEDSLDSVDQRTSTTTAAALISDRLADQRPVRDTIDLFGGLVPPHLRKAKREFSSSLFLVIHAANLSQRIGVLLDAVQKF